MKNLFTPHLVLSIIVTVLFLSTHQFVVAQELTVTLIPSNHNNFNISCFGGRDGSITATPANGTPPYTYKWSTDEYTATISNLAGGYYHVEVSDANSNIAHGEITLREPEPFRGVGLSAYTYPNGKNVTCHFCSDGSIATSVETGISPYSFQWADGAITQDRTAINAKPYQVIVTDANGCTVSGQITLIAPDMDVWTIAGNAGTSPANHFIGTSDAKDLVFKTKSVQAMRIDTTGKIKMNNFIGKAGMLSVDSNGVLQSSYRSAVQCNGVSLPGWYTFNNYVFTCPPSIVSINEPLVPPGNSFAINGNSYFNGMVGIGLDPVTESANASSSNYKLFVGGKVGAREVNVKASGAWPDYVFDTNYKLANLEEISSYVAQYKHLPDMPSAAEIETNGQSLGEIQRMQQQKIEELYLYIIKLEEKIQKLEDNK